MVTSMRWAAYARISEDRTGEEWGVERQLGEIERVIRARDPDPIITTFIENDTSAYKNKPRPKFTELMSRLGEFDVICAKHMDRLLRRLLELEETLQKCEKAGVFILTTHDGVDTSSEGGRLVARILASVAQGEVERKSARQKSAARQAATQGRWLGGRRPFGYLDGGLHPEESDLIRAGYASIISGASLHSIAKDWNSKGVKTTAGNKWTGPTVRQMLLNPRYAGVSTYYGEVVGEAQWPAVVDGDVFLAAQSVLTAPGRRPSSTARKYLMTGLLVCGKCENRMSAGVNPHTVYKCRHCGGVTRSQKPVDNLIIKLALAFLNSDEVLKLQKSGEDVAALRLKEKAVLDKIDQYAIEREEELLSARQVRLLTDRAEEKLADIRERLASATRDDVLNGAIGASREEWDSWDLSRRRNIIQTIGEFTLHPSGGASFKPEQLTFRWRIQEEG